MYTTQECIISRLGHLICNYTVQRENRSDAMLCKNTDIKGVGYTSIIRRCLRNSQDKQNIEQDITIHDQIYMVI